MSFLKNVDKKVYLFLLAGMVIIGATVVVDLVSNIQYVSAAAADYYLKIDGIDGSSTAYNHKGEIEVMSWSWGVSNPGSMSTGTGMGAGKVSISSFNFMKKVDKSSPSLYRDNISGTHIPNVYLKLNSSGLTLHMTDVTVDSYGLSGPGSGMTESVSFNFAKMEVSYPSK